MDGLAKPIVPKEEILEFELAPDALLSRHAGDSTASSSGSNLRSFFEGMGFRPSLVNKVIEEKGEDNVDLLLETLFAYSAVQNSNSASSDSLGGLLNSNKDRTAHPGSAAEYHQEQVPQRANSESSDSLDSLFDDKGASSPQNIPAFILPKEEPDDFDEVTNDKKISLLAMKFTVTEVEFAINKLGEDAPINELVDFIIAAQIAQKFEDADDTIIVNDEKKDINDETLFGTMDTTLRLLEMGFSENEVSLAIEKFGSDTPISELADHIVAGRIADNKWVGKNKYTSKDYRLFGSAKVKTEDLTTDPVPLSRCLNIGKRPKQEYMDDNTLDPVSHVEENRKGKMPKQEYMNDHIPFSVSQFHENHKGKRPKEEYPDESSFGPGRPMWLEEKKVGGKTAKYGMPKLSQSNICKSVDRMVSKPPYFFYGNVLNLSHDSWAKISQFLYALAPEFVNAQFFSALVRKEGYVHNLPTKNRSHILPKPAMTIEDAIPHTKKWWPSWDTRKQLSCISTETSGTSQLCERLGRILTDSRGLLSSEQQRDILHHCRTLNLVWIGHHKLGSIEPQHLERILGYPTNHTDTAESSLIERLQSLKYCFQTDALGYHLSVLKSMYPEGLTVLSIFTGIGGAEIALHRLGIRLKGVVSVEISQIKRKILQRWWQNSGQTGELVQIEDIQKLTSTKIESLMKKFGGFDFLICQNSCSRSSSSIMTAEDEGVTGFDFSLFYEFVRVLQRVRTMMERKR